MSEENNQNEIIDKIVMEILNNNSSLSKSIFNLYNSNSIYSTPLGKQYETINNLIEVYKNDLVKKIITLKEININDEIKIIESEINDLQMKQPSAPDIKYLSYSSPYMIPPPEYINIPLSPPPKYTKTNSLLPPIGPVKYETYLLDNKKTRKCNIL